MSTSTLHTVDDVWAALKEVMDPEIPTISLVDLGVVTHVELIGASGARVRMTPTFAGCPAMEYMRAQVERRLVAMGFTEVDVVVSMDVPWSTNRLTDQGREALKRHGLAPPPVFDGLLQLEVLNSIACPNCESRNTELRSPFGPTLCRSLHYCRDCGEAFEGFKPI